MGSFFSKYTFLIIWILVIVAVGAGFVYVVHTTFPNQPTSQTATSTSTNPSGAPAPTQPSVTLTIQKSGTGNSLLVQWQNLPAGTTQLNIFRGTTNDSSTWSLWNTINLTPDELGNGMTTINLGTQSENGYSFYVQTGNGSSNSTSTGQSGGWTSGIIQPGVSTSTSPTNNPGHGNGGNPGGSPGNTQSPTSSATSSPLQNTPTSTPQQTTTTPPTSTPNGTPYYNPQVQIEGYQPAQTDNFWVQHVDQKIQIGWQDLPTSTTSIVILRSSNENGPWSVELTQNNPGVNGAYAIQVVDDTLGEPYYYEMNANAGSSTITTYGPVYLAPAQ